MNPSRRPNVRFSMPLMRAVLVAACLLMHAELSEAQSSDHRSLRGVVRNRAGAPVEGAVVVVTRAPDMVSVQSRTDSSGTFAIDTLGGNGEYLLFVSAAGFRPARMRVLVPRVDEAVTAEVTLDPYTQELDAVRVVAPRGVPPVPSRLVAGSGSAEGLADGTPAALGPDLADAAGLARASLAGIVDAEGWSVAGLPSRETQVRLNGLVAPELRLPQTVPKRLRLAASSYDIADGGFSGGLLAVEIPRASEFRSLRIQTSGAMKPIPYAIPVAAPSQPELYLDVGGDTRFRQGSAGISYGVRVESRTQSATTMRTMSDSALGVVGVDPEVAREVEQSLLAQIALRRSERAAPVRAWSVTGIARVDPRLDPDRTSSIMLSVTSSAAPDGTWAPLSIAQAGRKQRLFSGSVQWSTSRTTNRLTRWDQSFGITLGERSTSPFVAPFVNLMVTTVDSAGGGGYGAAVRLGGEAGGTREQRFGVEQRWQRDAFVGSRDEHRLRLILAWRVDRLQLERDSLAGVVAFDDLRAFVNATPTFTESAASRSRATAAVGRIGAGVSSEWRPSSAFRVQYGVRVDQQALLDAPYARPPFAAPTVSPRVGVSWQVRSPTEGDGFSSSSLFSRHLVPPGILRAGFGVFHRDLEAGDALWMREAWGGSMLRRCARNTLTLPISRAGLDPAAVDAACAASPASSLTRSAAQLGDSFRPPYSFRGTASYLARWRGVDIEVGGLVNDARRQPRTVNRLVPPTPTFLLSGEGSRSFFSPAAAIDTATGIVSPELLSGVLGARADWRQLSDLRTRTLQGTFQVSPRGIDGEKVLRLGYVFSRTRTLESGWDHDVFGNPGRLAWGDSRQLPQHQFQLEFGRTLGPAQLTVWTRAGSGARYAPLVAGDVNGDGVLGNDRAWLPSTPAGDPALFAAIDQLFTGANSRVRQCLRRTARDAGSRSPCRDPWSAQSALSLSVELREIFARRRGSLSLFVENLEALADRFIHGQELRGWGRSIGRSRNLLRPSGFDATTNSFRYEVNPAFGRLARGSTANLEGFRVTITFSFPLAPSIQHQQVERWLRVRGIGERQPIDTLAGRFARNVPPLYESILEDAGDLLLEPAQIAVLIRRQGGHRLAVDSIWRELATRLSALPQDFDVERTVAEVESATDRVWELSRLEARRLRDVLTPIQQRLLPATARMLMSASEPLRQKILYY